MEDNNAAVPVPQQAGDNAAEAANAARISAMAASRIKLPAFEPEDPVPWFTYAELQFRLHQVTVAVDQFTVVAASFLPGSAIFREAAPVLLRQPDNTSYTLLKEFLLRGHVASQFQRLERILTMEPLGARRPTDLLAEMQVLCPQGEEDCPFFRHLFMRKLPAEIRNFFIEDQAPLRTIAERPTYCRPISPTRPT